MDIRLSNTQQQIANLNAKLEQALQSQRRSLATRATAQGSLRTSAPLTTNAATTNATASTNLNFTWTGSTLTVAWTAGYIQTVAGVNFSVPAGSQVLAASTTYSAFWNNVHQQLVFSTSANVVPLSSNSNNINICTLTTGTSGQSGWVGGAGGSPQGFGTVGATYSNF
jgi:hypothetical protein